MKMYERSKILALAVLVCLPLSLFASIPIQYNEDIRKEPAKFVISSWDYPDEYGQGIESFDFYQNSSGTWEIVGDQPLHKGLVYYNSSIMSWNWTHMKIKCFTWINTTLTGITTTEEGQQIQRHNITVINDGTTLFNQENFTYLFYDSGIYPDLWRFGYEVILDFAFVDGEIYVATIDYEIYFEGIEYGGSYLHNCSDTSEIIYDSNAGLGPSDYGIGSDGDSVEIWIVPDSVADEKAIYKLDFTDIDNSNGDINLTVRYKVEDGFTGFRLDLYYTDTSSDSTGLQTSQTWANLTIDADSGKTLDYALLYCDDYPNSVTSGNRSVYIDFIEITNPTDTLEYWDLRWNTISTVIIFFTVSYDYWALNMMLIFGGLIIMLLSVCIMAVKVRDRTITRDAGILLLFLFFVGWGLFIGGAVIG